MRTLTPILILCITWPLSTWAQEQRWYQLEVLIFRNLSGDAQFEEQWPSNLKPSLPVPSYQLPEFGSGAGSGQQSLQLFEAEDGTDWGELAPSTRATTTPRSAQLVYKPVPSGETRLSTARSRLANRGEYQVLAYHAWRQPLLTDAAPVYFHVGAGEYYGPYRELEGSLGFSLKRYLHVDTELWWSEVEPDSGAAQDDSPANGRVAYLKENRRLRSGEVHYLDHPLIGVMLRINQVGGG